MPVLPNDPFLFGFDLGKKNGLNDLRRGVVTYTSPNGDVYTPVFSVDDGLSIFKKHSKFYTAHIYNMGAPNATVISALSAFGVNSFIPLPELENYAKNASNHKVNPDVCFMIGFYSGMVASLR